MFRRSRFSIRPNVSTGGRTATTPQETPSVSQEATETPKDVSGSSTAPAATENKSVLTPSEKPTAPGDGNDQNGEGTSSSAALQRRKRFSVKPKVAPGRLSTLTRMPKSPAKAVLETPVEIPGSNLDKPTTSQTGTTATPPGLRSPRRRRLSEETKQSKVQPIPTAITADSTGLLVEDSLEQTHLPADSDKQLESSPASQVKEVPSRPPDKVPPSLPDKEAIEISEKAKTLVSSKSDLSLSPPALSLSRLLNDPSDLQRIAKARKLRELLRQEMHKEKKIKRAKARAKECTIDPAKMTMRDLIRYLPVSNPMSSSLEESAQENETVVPPSPGREESPERAQEPEVLPKVTSPRAEEEEDAEEEEEEALMVPQVKVAEDGSLIIDEESLTVEVQRSKGPNPAQERDPIFERGSTTTYSSFRKGTYSKPWSSEETDMFFLAISMVGTDFSMICQLFPHRARSEIKNKFKKEERENAWRIDKAFRERRKLDIEYFSKLLEKILEVQQNRKKLKSLAEKNSPKKRKRKTKGKKAAKTLSDVEEEEENETPDLEEEGEKENEDLCNEGGTPVSKPKKKRKRKNKDAASTEEPNEKINKMGEKSNEQDEACIPEDAEAALPEDRTNPDTSEKAKTVNTAKDTAIKPAKLSRGRVPKPLLPLGRKWGKKPAPTPTKAKDIESDKGDECLNDGASEEQANQDTSPLKKDEDKRLSASDDVSSEEEDAAVQPPRPTRYGRVPKPTKTLTYPAKEDVGSSASETTPASPAGSTAPAVKPKPKCRAKRGRSSKQQSAQEPKKPKLVTLRATQSEYSDEENDKQWEEEEMQEEEEHPSCSSSKDSIAPAFVPASLRSPHPMISEVEETMEELDILATMPDVLGISQDALCPDASCEQAQNDTAEPCEHQLDLLVDVIDFLSSEHTEVAEDESYNEAAQTLLTIGNLAHLSQSAQNETASQDYVTGTTSVSGYETSHQLKEDVTSTPAAQEENSATSLTYETSSDGVLETLQPVVTVELQNSTTESDDMPIIKISDQTTGSDVDATPQLQSSPESSKKNSPPAKRGRLSKVKLKPNVSQASRSAQSKCQAEILKERTAESHTVSPDVSQATETLSDSSQKLLKDKAPCIEVTLAEEPSGSQSRSVGLVTSNTAATESQIGQKAPINSAPVQESSARPVPSVTPAEDLPVSQKEESGDASPHQIRKSQFQEAKPNLAETSRKAHSKPQTTKDIVEDSSLTPDTQYHEKITEPVEVEAEPTSTISEKTSQSSVPASDSAPSLDTGSKFTPKEELSTDVEKDVGGVSQTESSSATSDQTTESSCNNLLTSDSAVPELQVGQKSNTDPAAIQESSLHPVPCETSVEELPASQEEENKDTSTCQTRRGRLQKRNPKPNLPQRSSPVQSKSQTTKDPVTHVQLEENPPSPPSRPESMDHTIAKSEAQPTCGTASPEKPSQIQSTGSDLVSEPALELCSPQKPTEKLPSTEEPKTDVGSVTDSEGSEQRRRRFPKVKPKPNLRSSARTTQTKQQSSDISKPSEQSHMDTSLNVTSENQTVDNAQTGLKMAETESKHLTSTACSLHTEHFSSTKLKPAESEKSQDSSNDMDISSDGVVIATSLSPPSQSVLTGSALDNKSSERPTAEGESTGDKLSNNDKVEAAKTQPTKDPATISDVQPSEDASAESIIISIHPSNTLSTPDPKEETQQPHSEAQSQAAETNQTAASSKSSRKAPQRERFVKPKPNLGRSRQPPQARQGQNTKQAETDSGTHSQGASASHKPESEPRPDVQEPAEGAIEQHSNQNSPPNVAGPALGFLTEISETSTQDASSSSSTGGTHPDLTIFPDMLSEQVPSDPDEPFFILSLTEIPVCSSGEVADSASEPLPYLPVTDASARQQSSVPGGPVSNFAVPVPTEKSGATGFVSVKDAVPDTPIGLIVQNPVDQHETTKVQPSISPESEPNDETEIPPENKKLMGTGRAAKLQVKPNTARKKEASKTNTAKDAESVQTDASQDSELPGTSGQPKASDKPQKGSGDNVDIEKEALHDGKVPDDGSSGAQTAQTRKTLNRKPKSSPSSLPETSEAATSSDSPPGKAASKGRKCTKAPRAAGKRSAKSPAASTSCDVAPTPQPLEETPSTSPTTTEPAVDDIQTPEHSRTCSDSPPQISPFAAEVSTSQQSDCVASSSADEEPTFVSQYFLSDIFTEVEEG